MSRRQIYVWLVIRVAPNRHFTSCQRPFFRGLKVLFIVAYRIGETRLGNLKRKLVLRNGAVLSIVESAFVEILIVRIRRRTFQSLNLIESLLPELATRAARSIS